jgi:hypothetical protein
VQKQADSSQELLANYNGENLPAREVAQQHGRITSTAWRQLGMALDFLQKRLREKGIAE